MQMKRIKTGSEIDKYTHNCIGPAFPHSLWVVYYNNILVALFKGDGEGMLRTEEEDSVTGFITDAIVRDPKKAIGSWKVIELSEYSGRKWEAQKYDIDISTRPRVMLLEAPDEKKK